MLNGYHYPMIFLGDLNTDGKKQRKDRAMEVVNGMAGRGLLDTYGNFRHKIKHKKGNTW
jgi:hypothetical protein